MINSLRRSRLSPISKKRQQQHRQYAALVKQLLAERPICELWLKEHGWRAVGMGCYARQGSTGFVTAEELLKKGAWPSQCCHHKRGRGKFYLDYSTFAALSNQAHARVHDNPRWAEANGWLDLRRNSRSSFLTS